MPHLMRLAVAWLFALGALGASAKALAQLNDSSLALSSLRSVQGDTQLLSDNIEFSLQVIHSVKFPLTRAALLLPVFCRCFGVQPPGRSSL